MINVHEILKKKKERKEKLEVLLKVIIDQLKDFGVLKIVLFGSLKNGEIDVNSDLDLLVIVPSDRSSKEWSNRIYESTKRGLASDLIVYTEKELKDNLANSSFLRDILSNGTVVYEKKL